MRRWHGVRRTVRLTAAILALASSGFTVAASFHHHDPPPLQAQMLAAEGGSVAPARVHDCLACRLSQGVAILAATQLLPGRAPAMSGSARIHDVPLASLADLTPSAPRAPPGSSLIPL